MSAIAALAFMYQDCIQTVGDFLGSIRHVGCQIEICGEFNVPTDFHKALGKHLEPLQMHSQDIRCLVDTELLGGVGEGFAVFTAVPIATTEELRGRKLTEGRINGICISDLQTQIKQWIIDTGGMLATVASHLTLEVSTEDGMNHCGLLDAGIQFWVHARKTDLLHSLDKVAQEFMRILLAPKTELLSNY